MLQHYLEIKKANPQRLVLYRMGDFFELFFEDAKRASELLSLTLTMRGVSAGQPVPMAGVPARALDTYLKKLVDLGQQVVLVDQTGEATEGSKLMRREVVRIVTPGTLTDESLLSDNADLLVASLCRIKDTFGLAWLDLNGGRLQVMELTSSDRLEEQLSRLTPAELLLSDEMNEVFSERHHCIVRPDWEFDVADGTTRLLEQLQVPELKVVRAEVLQAGLGALGSLLCYAAETQRTALPHLRTLEIEHSNTLLQLDPASRTGLEVDSPLSGQASDRHATLLYVLDDTATPMGQRMLRRWLNSPMRNREQIEARLDAIQQLMEQDPSGDCKPVLRRIGDLERVLSRLMGKAAPPRDLDRLRQALRAVPELLQRIQSQRQPLDVLTPLLDGATELEGLHALLNKALAETPATHLNDGEVIAAGYDEQLDNYRDMANHGSALVREMEEAERAKTGIGRLRINYTKLHGYCIEVPRSRSDELPENYRPVQSLKSTQRLVTDELLELESSLLNSQTMASRRQRQLYEQLMQEICSRYGLLRCCSEALAQLDIFAALARISLHWNYCRPELMDDGAIAIEGGRHPVLERLSSNFVANDTHLQQDRCLLIITGPNMGGKSTYMRQTALIVLMAHVGCFVPARKARIGLMDAIMTRIGASDRLAQGMSTFMVEMTEAARILRTATPRTLVIMDEMGRGTSTEDGLALAEASAQYLLEHCQALCMFATHYLEISDLARRLPQAANLSFTAHESPGGALHFDHRVHEGPASTSFGLQVAQLAGVPAEVIRQSQEILLSRQHKGEQQEARQPSLSDMLQPRQPEKPDRDPREQEFLVLVRALNPDSMTPREALDALYQLYQALHGQQDSE